MAVDLEQAAARIALAAHHGAASEAQMQLAAIASATAAQIADLEAAQADLDGRLSAALRNVEDVTQAKADLERGVDRLHHETLAKTQYADKLAGEADAAVKRERAALTDLADANAAVGHLNQQLGAMLDHQRQLEENINQLQRDLVAKDARSKQVLSMMAAAEAGEADARQKLAAGADALLAAQSLAQRVTDERNQFVHELGAANSLIEELKRRNTELQRAAAQRRAA